MSRVTKFFISRAHALLIRVAIGRVDSQICEIWPDEKSLGRENLEIRPWHPYY